MPRDSLSGERRRRRSTVTGSKRDAQRMLRQALNERDHGIDVSPDRLDLSTYLNRWLAGARHALKASTLGGYERDVRNHYEPTLGGRLLRDLRAADIQVFVDLKLGEGLSGRTVPTAYRAIPRPMRGRGRLPCPPSRPRQKCSRLLVCRHEVANHRSQWPPARARDGWARLGVRAPAGRWDARNGTCASFGACLP